jgi:3-phosphoshikimate 1-carboxyvinyltransferase
MTVSISVPGSKSMTQRALIISALAENPSVIENALICDDSKYLTSILKNLGIAIEWHANQVKIAPAKFRKTGETQYCGNAGTAMRFASCLSLLFPDKLCLDGDQRMRQRPIGSLGTALESLGIQVSYMEAKGCPPLCLEKVTKPSSTVDVDISISSQYLSGLLMVAPKLEQGLLVNLKGKPVSLPYVEMTSQMMGQAGARIEWQGQSSIRVSPGSYNQLSAAQGFVIEPDWSAAAFILGAAQIVGCQVEIPGLLPAKQSLQGDSAFGQYLEELARPQKHEFDLSHTPDLIAPLAAVALFASHPSRISSLPGAIQDRGQDRRASRGYGYPTVDRIPDRSDTA